MSASAHSIRKRIRRLAQILILVLAAIEPAIANAKSCSKEIEKLQRADHLVKLDPDAGPSAPQSIGAQLGYQPTPRSVARGEARVQSQFRRELARAKALDQAGDRAGCKRIVARVREAFLPLGREARGQRAADRQRIAPAGPAVLPQPR